MNKICWKIRTWAFSFTSIKVLFLTFIACLFHFIELVIETVYRFRVIHHALIRDGVFLMVIINWPWYLLQLFWVCKITSGSVAHSYFLEIVAFRFECLETISHCLIHVRHLFLDGSQTWWEMESSKFTDGEYLVSVIPVLAWWIFGWCWRAATLEIYSSSWKPW